MSRMAWCALLVVSGASVLSAQDGGIIGGGGNGFVRVNGGFSSLEKQPQPTLGTGVISGVVINSLTQEPIKKAHVTLNGSANLNAMTDSSGTFTFRALPAGPYFLNANQIEFYPNPFAVNVDQITLKDAEEKHDVKIKLTPGATITGRVVNEEGEPVNNCQVGAFGPEQQIGRRILGMRSQSNTDEKGVYRLHGLQQGRYQLRTHCWDSFPAPHGFMRRNDPLAPREGYPPVAYSPENAAQTAVSGLRVTSGQELSGIDFHVKRVPLFNLQVAVAGNGAQQPNVLVWSKEPGEENMPHGSDGFRQNAYSFSNLPAGSYSIEALIQNNTDYSEAHQDVEIGKTKVTNVSMTLAAASKIPGTVEYDDPTKAPGSVQVIFFSLSGSFQGPVPQAQTGADGKVELTALPGHYRLNWNGPGYVKQMTVGGQEVSTSDFEIAPSVPFHIVVGTKSGKLEVDTGAKVASGETVSAVLVPESREFSPNGENIGMADPNGHVVFPNVTPGKYKLVVIPTQNPWNLINMPDLLKALAATGKSIEMTEGGDQQTTAPAISAEDLQKLIESAE